MAEIFNIPKGIKAPSSFRDREVYKKECETFTNELKKYLADHNFKDKNAGEIIRFPTADSYAEYMVISMKPARLFHMPLGDAWNFQYIHLMTAKEIQEKIDQQNALKKLFTKK